MPASNLPLLHVYARNVEYYAFKRSWQPARLASELGVTLNGLNRIRFVRNRYIDPEIFVAMLKLFECEPNDLLLPCHGIDYALHN